MLVVGCEAHNIGDGTGRTATTQNNHIYSKRNSNS